MPKPNAAGAPAPRAAGATDPASMPPGIPHGTLQAAGATPAMAQWFAVKAEQPDALLFFRMGDFYELFFHDAEAAAAALDIQLTHRGEHAGSPIPMCGVPVHAAESYLSRLIRRGFRVAVVEQMEKPGKGAKAKTPIRREVVRVVTPGTLTEDTLLESGRPNLLLAVCVVPGADKTPETGAAWMDISTGLFETARLGPGELPALLGRLDPAELLVAGDAGPLHDYAGRRAPDQAASPPAMARSRVADAFGVASIDAFGSFTDAEACAAALALDYVRATQAGKLPRLSRPVPCGPDRLLHMDAATRASLEITRARDGGADHTLLSAISRTVSAAGCRMLAAHLQAPLTDLAAIAERQARWAWLLDHAATAQTLRTLLRGTPDMARGLGRLALGRLLPRDLAGIRDGLAVADRAAECLDSASPFAALRPALAGGRDLADLLWRALEPAPPARLDDGGAIVAGFDGELDAHRALRDESRRVIAGLQLDYAQRFGVASLKIKHHQQLGYVIEAPAVAVETLRAHPDLQLRQGMANGARFTHPELSDLDRRIADAAEQASLRERAILDHLSTQVLAQADAVHDCADALAVLDVAAAAASLAEGGSWCRPTLEDSDAFCIIGGRHPVVEAALSGQAAFVPNDCDLSADRRLMLLTGPNMAGKSTFLRQNALMVILAQAGLPVPAQQASIGVVDRLFSRVGASDDLARGRSTFMVEMTETAAILHQAGPRSLIVVDEIGRGTGTLDGLAIAWAVLESLHFQNRCRTIFATHFHELVQLDAELPRLSPHTMKVREWGRDVRFLHEVAAGAAGRSWGVHVAQLAGVPAPIVRRAAQLLAALERNGPITAPASLPLFAAASSAGLDDTTGWPVQPADALRDALSAIEPDRLTPREALDALYRLKTLATGTAEIGSVP